MNAMTLTARLLGDPAPDREARAEALRAALQPKAEVTPMNNDEREAIVLKTLLERPLAPIEVAHLVNLPRERARDLLRMMENRGLVYRTGGGTGVACTLKFNLVEEQRAIVASGGIPKGGKKPESRQERLLRLIPLMADGPVCMSDLAASLGLPPRNLRDALDLGIADGLVARFGGGRGAAVPAAYGLTRAGQASASRGRG